MTDEIPDFVLDDVAVPPQRVAPGGTISIEIVPAQAIAAGRAYEQQAARAIEAAEAATIPPLPDEPQPMSRHGRRFVDPASRAPEFEYEPYLKQRPGFRPAPEGFWREFVYGVTFTLINLGDSRAVRERKAVDARIAAPFDTPRFVPVISRQGGVGSTTVTTLLGLALAEGRDTPVAAVDAHPDRGTLRDVVSDDARLEVLSAAPVAPAGVVLTDGASGWRLRDALRDADGVVVVSGGTAAQARLASETVTWLEQNDLAGLAENAVVAIDTATPGTRYESLDAIEAHFQARVRDVVRIPYDEELVAGTPVRYGALRPDTRAAARDLAALVIDGLVA